MTRTRKICVLGNYSGRNAGDAAILGGLFREITAVYENIEFVVPTLNPTFVRETYVDYHVTPVNIMPWYGCVKLLGPRVWRAMRRSDLVLLTDAIMFDRGLYNPLHNYLSTLALWIPMAHKQKIPVVLYNCSLGPIHTRTGHWCLKRVLNHASLVILRDEESRKVAALQETIGIRVVAGADSALSARPSAPWRIQQLLKEQGIMGKNGPVVGVNLNAYGDAFVRDNTFHFSQEALVSLIADTAEWIMSSLGADVWLFGMQHMDLKILQALRARIQTERPLPLFSNRHCSYQDMLGLFGELDLLVGMRTHSTILASSAGTPVIAIVTYPKTYGYMERIGLASLTIPLQQLDTTTLQAKIGAVWQHRYAMRQEINAAVAVQRQLAAAAPVHLGPYLQEQTPGVYPES